MRKYACNNACNYAYVTAACAGMALFGCGGTAFVNTAELPDSYQCRHMKEVCTEAREFENAYARLPADEKSDAENVLKAYRLQCNDALELCKKSAPKK